MLQEWIVFALFGLVVGGFIYRRFRKKSGAAGCSQCEFNEQKR